MDFEMLDYAHQRVIEIMGKPSKVVLATNGPAGVQLSELPCEPIGVNIYLFVPQTSDQLFNLEHNSMVTLLGAGWEMKGEARIIPKGKSIAGLELHNLPGAEWCVLVQVCVRQLNVHREGGWGNLETIDLKP
jgi:hypothetical protein